MVHQKNNVRAKKTTKKVDMLDQIMSGMTKSAIYKKERFGLTHRQIYSIINEATAGLPMYKDMQGPWQCECGATDFSRLQLSDDKSSYTCSCGLCHGLHQNATFKESQCQTMISSHGYLADSASFSFGNGEFGGTEK
jgi:hypothetical protein